MAFECRFHRLIPRLSKSFKTRGCFANAEALISAGLSEAQNALESNNYFMFAS